MKPILTIETVHKIEVIPLSDQFDSRETTKYDVARALYCLFGSGAVADYATELAHALYAAKSYDEIDSIVWDLNARLVQEDEEGK